VIVAVRATFVHGLLAALGCWSVWSQFVYRTPQRFATLVLVLVTLASTGLTVTSWLAQVYHAIVASSRPRRFVELGSRVCALTILAFAFWGLLLFGNGKLDGSDAVVHATQIVEIGAGETDLGLALPFTWASLQSWQDASQVERVLLRPDERARLWGGQPVVVLVHPGFFGVTWVSAIEPDVARLSRDVLAILPDAVEVWKELAAFNLRIGHFEDARKAAGEYAARFPRDPEFPVHVASVLLTRERFADVVTLLSPVAEAHQHAGAYMYLGYALGMQGRHLEGLSYLERARDMDPDNWWPHYALGLVYAARGDTGNAVRSFERTLQLRPGLPDVEQHLQRLRPRTAGQRG
jgi:hypothetical protein